MNLRAVIEQAEKEGKAIGHFNISNLETLWGIFNVAKSMEVPVIIGVSEGEREFVGVNQAVALVKSLRKEFSLKGEEYPVFLNADHTRSFGKVKEVIDAGFDSVIFDGADLSLEENIEQTKKCVQYARASGRNVLIEGELGYIGMSSKLLDEIPEGVSLDNLTTIEDAQKFVQETGVDFLAPSVGNIHGMLKNAKNPNLDIERIKELREKAGIPLVLHGGSGISEDDFRKAISAGISSIHVNTEIRVAYKKALKESVESSDEIAPYRFLRPALNAVSKVVGEKIRLFNNLPR